jgi:hypothetical protein
VALTKVGPDGARAGLRTLLDAQSSSLSALTEAIGRRYFDLVEKGITWVRSGAREAQ